MNAPRPNALTLPATLAPVAHPELAALADAYNAAVTHLAGMAPAPWIGTILAAIPAAFEAAVLLEQSFDLYQEADRRGIELWRAENPNARALSWPDKGKLVAWLLERLDAQTKEHLRRAAETHRRCADDLDAQEAKHAARVTELLEANNREVERRRAAERRIEALERLEEERTKAQKMEEVHAFAVRRGCPPGTWIMPWLMDYAASLELMNESAKKGAEELADKHNALARQDSANAVRIHDLERRVRELEEERLATLERWVPRCTDAEAERDLLLVRVAELERDKVIVPSLAPVEG